MKGKVTTIIRVALMVIALIGMLVCVISSTIFYLRNPDMTELRRFIECPWPTIGAVVCLALYGIGKYVI